MMVHDQNTERLIKEISASKSGNIAAVFHASRGETCPPYSQWIRRSLLPTLLTPEHERLLTCAPLHCLRGTRFTPFTDLIFTIFFFIFTQLTNKNDGGRIADWLPVRSNVSTFFPSSVSSSSPTAFSFVAEGSELSRPPCRAATWATIDWRPTELSRNHKRPAPSPLAAEAILRTPAFGLIMNLRGTRAQTRGM